MTPARLAWAPLAVLSACLLPAAARATDDPPAPAPVVVSASCEITGTLQHDAPSSTLPDGTAGGPVAKGTPSGTLADGRTCVRPAAAPEPAPAPQPEPAPTPQPAPAETPAPAPAEEPSPQVQVEPEAAAPTARPATRAPLHTTERATEPLRSARRSHRRADTNLRVHRRPQRAHDEETAPLQTSLPGPEKPPFYVSDEAVIPRFLLRLYRQAGRRSHVPWPILAAINEIETDFGRNVAVSPAGAIGWMQFMPSTWALYGVDADHNGTKDPRAPRDAIFAAARYLRASGARTNLRRALFTYNHAGWYVDSVLLRAERIAAQQGERSRRLTQLLESRARRLEDEVLADPRITIYPCGRRDIAAHRVDRRVLIALRFLAWSRLNPTVSSLECGHGRYTSEGNVSEHSSGNAVDISAINGVPILGNQGPGSVTEATIRELLTLRGAGRPHQIISLMTFDDVTNAFALSDHADHIHVGFAPLKPIDPHGLVEGAVPTDSIAPPAVLAPLAPIVFRWALSG
jgi:soluble lytic murein transglycosylase-like protein